jgi:hypothetical protein
MQRQVLWVERLDVWVNPFLHKRLHGLIEYLHNVIQMIDEDVYFVCEDTPINEV